MRNYNEPDLKTDAKAQQRELEEKRRRIELALSEHNLDAILISRNENVAWATAGLVDMRVGVQRETGEVLTHTPLLPLLEATVQGLTYQAAGVLVR